MKSNIDYLRYALLATAAFVVINMVYSISSFDMMALGFVLWNLAPCFLGYIIINQLEATSTPIGFVVGILAFTIFIHSSWMLDVAGFQTGSSTSALVFIFAPVYSVLLGLIGAGVGVVISKLAKN
jgi:hypothetical protein